MSAGVFLNTVYNCRLLEVQPVACC